MKPGRRAFFLPRLAAATPWANFCQRLARAAAGRVDDETPESGSPGRARLYVQRDEDVFHARALCGELGVLLVLPGAEFAGLPAERHWLMLDIGGLSRLGDLDVARGRIDADAGCTLGDLRRAIAHTDWRWPHGDDSMTVAAWLAQAAGWLPGRCRDSGLIWADVMLAGGEFERLGPFGVAATRPLRSAASSRLVSSLFEWSASATMQTLLAQPQWLARYRLDALTPQSNEKVAAASVASAEASGADDDVAPNPAHLLLGSAGTLAWAGRVQLQLRHASLPALAAPLGAAASAAQVDAFFAVNAGAQATPVIRRHEIEDLDDLVKGFFDPSAVFPSPVV